MLYLHPVIGGLLLALANSRIAAPIRSNSHGEECSDLNVDFECNALGGGLIPLETICCFRR
jgi:hypothetical protein